MDRDQSVVAPSVAATGETIPLVIPPADELMREFSNLGDNCEFGLVQRQFGAEPMDLLRFSRADLDQVVRAIDSAFADVGNLENVKAEWTGEEFFVTETEYKFAYHTFINDPALEPGRVRTQQSTYLKMLARKCLEELGHGERIFVRKGNDSTDETQLVRLFDAIRRHGQSWLLWVVPSDQDHPPGTVELRRPGFLKAYIDRFAPYSDASISNVACWLQICRRAYAWVRYGIDVLNVDQLTPMNLIENGTAFGGWSGSPSVTSEGAWAMPPPRDGAAVLRHVLIRDTDEDTRLAYVWSGSNRFAPETVYVASALIWVPADFAGSQIAMEIAGCASLTQVSADLSKRDCWQQIWVAVRSAPDQADAVIFLFALGRRQSAFYSSCWRLEREGFPTPPAELAGG